MIATRGYHVDLDETTPKRWHAAMQAMRVTDSYADQADNQDRIVYLLDVLATLDESFPDLSAENLGPTRYSKLIRGAATIIKYGEQLRTAPSAGAYVDIRATEAQETAEVVTQLATDYVTSQPNYVDGFVPSVTRMATAAGFVDTAIDATRDFREGMLAFTPSMAFRAYLLKRGAAELLPLAPHLMKPKIMNAFGTLAIQALKSEHLKSR